MTSLGGAHVVITGGSSGIGLATARQAVARGARVSLLARDEARLADAAASVGAVATASVDVARCRGAPAPRSTRSSRRAVRATCCSPPAGSSHPGYFEQLDDAVFRDQMEVDYFGTLHAIRAVVPSMIERGRGHVVTVSSTAGLIGVFGYTAYGPAKYAVRGLAETLRSELAPARDRRGVRVPARHPHARLRRRERAQAARDRTHLRRHQAAGGRRTWRRRSCAASRRTGS